MHPQVKTLWLCLFGIVSFQVTSAQTPVFRQYATQEVNQRIISENREVRERQREIERRVATTSFRPPTEDITIPVVFHIVHTDVLDVIDPLRIVEQIDILNAAFRMELQPERDVAAYLPNLLDEANAVNISYPIALDPDDLLSTQPNNIGIQFCLATPEGTTGSGSSAADVNYVTTENATWSVDDAIKNPLRGGVAPREPERFLNIWVTDLADGVSGYAQMPGGLSATDGIVIDKDFFGTDVRLNSPYNEGKTLIHLIGNYLGLIPLWGNFSCGNDYVRDTPIHNAPNYGCPAYQHITSCYPPNSKTGFRTEMTMNYMDNTDDVCTWMFTRGQMTRMHQMLQVARSGLIHAPALDCATEIIPLATLAEELAPIALSQTTEVIAAQIFPNPVTEQMHIRWQSEHSTARIAVFSVTGKLMEVLETSQIANGTTHTLNTSQWLAGIYFVRLQTATNNQIHKITVR